MPADRDTPADRALHGRPHTPPPSQLPTLPNLITDASDTVGFLDARNARPDDLVAAVRAAFERLSDGAVLTVYSHLPDVEAVLTRMSDTDPVAVIASLTHPDGGTTLTLRGP